jgi:ribosomal protein L7/L12
MKIRTDFVTNSSSFISAEIIIDNPVLLEILQKYKDMGLFGEHEPIFGIGVYETADKDYKKNGPESSIDFENLTKTPAFSFFEHQQEDPPNGIGIFVDHWPTKLEDVLKRIIEVINDYKAGEYLDKKIRDDLIMELHQREADILHAYSRVHWWSAGWGDEMDYEIMYNYDLNSGSTFEGEGYTQAMDIFDFMKAADRITYVEQKPLFDVIMKATGPKRIEVIRVIQRLTYSDMFTAKKMADTDNPKILHAVTAEHAADAKAKLELAGAEACITPVNETA